MKSPSVVSEFQLTPMSDSVARPKQMVDVRKGLAVELPKALSVNRQAANFQQFEHLRRHSAFVLKSLEHVRRRSTIAEDAMLQENLHRNRELEHGPSNLPLKCRSLSV
jgi:hypothetical protein